MTFENEDQTTEDRDGVLQDEENSNLEEQQDELNDDHEDDQESNPDDEDLRKSKNLAVEEAVRKHKMAKQARAEADTLRKENNLLKYASKGDMKTFGKHLNELYEEDPDLAEDVASRNWGMSYSQLKRQVSEQGGNTAPDSTDIEALIEEKLSQRDRKDRTVQVEKAENAFFIDNGISPTSRTFKNVLNEYDALKKEFGRPETKGQANKLLKLAYYEYNKNVKTPVDDNETVSLPGSPKSAARQRTHGKKRNVSADVKNYMIKQYGAQATKDFLEYKTVKFD